MQAYVKSHGDTWGAIVSIAYHCKPDQIDREAELLARATSTTKATLRRKFAAIHHKREQGWTEEAIAKEGQGPTLSSLAASRKLQKVEADTILRYRVPASLGEAWEELVGRLAKVANLKTSEDLIEFLHSVFVGLSDLQIQNLAGMIDPNRKGRRV
jgi:hypothetical protein